ncbi:MAG: 2-oxoglutarate dehydrogenase E2 component (dihydrolipoamide succinyltransferase) [Alphaproteobacteria bacterium]|jgi:2-oxoglutarate dehydrogenase E2 component (dihydrolipoamide succinyltransferase)
MTISIEAPTMGESITEATVAGWTKNVGDYVAEDELIAELETDKINLEVTAPRAGVITNILKVEGDTVNVGEVMAEIDETATAGTAAPAAEAPAPVAAEPVAEAAPVAPAPAAQPEATPASQPQPTAQPVAVATSSVGDLPLSPAVKKMIEENAIDPALITGSGKDGRLTKGDVLAYIENPVSVMPSAMPAPTPAAPVAAATPTASAPSAPVDADAREKRVKMTRLRKTIAGRLKTAQNNAAMLTTYNEVDLTAVMELRKLYKEKFEKEHGVKLGFMSFFTKATIEALKAWPALNAEIDGEELVYKNYFNIGVAVSTEKGLVVPVLKDADKMSFADIEQGIRNFATKARDGKLMPDDMTGGTYTITNGGTFGSMLSMPILNYPQVGILGMHNIIQRPVAIDGEVVIRPMMYLAMTYDHRIVDGREAVSFVVKIKEALENPSRMLLGV